MNNEMNEKYSFLGRINILILKNGTANLVCNPHFWYKPVVEKLKKTYYPFKIMFNAIVRDETGFLNSSEIFVILTIL